MIKRVSLLLFYIMVSFYVKGQELIFNHLTMENGLSQNSILSITQDSRGFMWYGSRFGLNRYDGYQFKLYKSDTIQTNTLTDDYVTALYNDRKGNLWVGTSNGLNRFKPETNTFERIYLTANHKSYPYNGIKNIYEDKKGQLWIATSNGLYLLLNQNINQFILASSLGLKSEIADNEVLSVYQDAEGYIWIGTNTGLTRFLFNKRINSVKTFSQSKTPGSISNNAVTGILEDNEKNLWVATENGGLNLFNRTTETFTPYLHDNKNSNSLVHNAIRTFIKSKSGDLWIGTQEGLSILNPKTKKFSNYQHRQDNPRSLNQNSIYSLYEDRNGSVWIGTYYGGVNVDYAYPTDFNRWQYNEKVSAINHNVVSSITQAQGDDLWIGTEGGGLNYYNSSLQTFKAYKYNGTDPESLGSDFVKIVYKDLQENIWVGTHGGGLNLFDPETNKFKRFLTRPSDLNTTRSEIVAILEDSNGVFWVGSQTGLRIFNKTQRKLKPFNIPPILKSFEDKNIKVLFEDSQKNMWIGTTIGLYVYSRKFNTLRTFKLPKGSNSIANNSNYINCIQEDSKGKIWVGLYYGGLTYINPEIQKPAPVYTRKDGLSNNNVLGIIEDENQQLWVSTSNGLNKFDPIQKTFQTYTTSDGLAGDEFNYNSFFTNKNGELFFGGYNGLTHFYPNQIQKNIYKAQVVFTRLKLFGTTVKINASDRLLKQDISLTKKLQFRHNQNIFTVEFALLNFIKSNKNKYAYKLQGINDQWTETDIPSATYNNLPSGTYNLLVKGANNDGVWSKSASLKIEILPPFYKTWWPFCIYAALLAIVLFFITRFFYLRQLIRKDEELHQIKLNFFTNVSHEIRTHLALIMAPIESLMDGNKDNTAISKQLNTVKLNADRLLRLVSELMDFRKAETKHLKLHIAEYDLISFISVIQSSFAALSKKKKINLYMVYDEELILLYFDKEQLEKVFFNLISNAFKFTPTGGSISIKIHLQENKVAISVEDTGHGIAPEFLDQLFTNFFQVADHNIQNTGYGIGLALSKNIVELHKGEINVTSTPSKDDSPGHTMFTINLLRGMKHFKNTTYLQPLVIQGQPMSTEATNVIESILPLEQAHHDAGDNRPIILIIEDHSELRQIIKESLEVNYQVITAKNGLEGWETAIVAIPDLIISDVMMPKMDGFTLCNQLKTDERTSHIPVILLTAKSSENDQVSGLSEGADNYLTKPFSNKILQLHVRNLLNARETLRKKFSKSLILEPSHLVVESRDEKFISRLIEIIEENMDNENFGVEGLSEAIGMSQSVLYKKIKALTGMSVNDFSKSIRLKRAAQLLKQKQHAVYQVSYMVGFADRKYFSREFKKQFGLTPTEYIENNKPV